MVQLIIGWFGYFYYYPITAVLEFIIKIFHGSFLWEQCPPYWLTLFSVILQNVVYYYLLKIIISFCENKDNA